MQKHVFFNDKNSPMFEQLDIAAQLPPFLGTIMFKHTAFWKADVQKPVLYDLLCNLSSYVKSKDVMKIKVS